MIALNIDLDILPIPPLILQGATISVKLGFSGPLVSKQSNISVM